MTNLVHNERKGQQQNDCSVRALWSLSGKTYNECIEILRSVGRKDNDGVRASQLREAYKVIGAAWSHFLYKKPTFNQWYREHADHSKNYAVIVRGHIFAVRKGVVYGNRDDAKRLRARVVEFAEVNDYNAPKDL